MSNFKERESLHFLMGAWNRSRRVCGINNILEVMEWMGGNTTFSSQEEWLSRRLRLSAGFRCGGEDGGSNFFSLYTRNLKEI